MKENLKYTLMVAGMVISWSIYYAVSKIVVDATGRCWRVFCCARRRSYS